MSGDSKVLGVVLLARHGDRLGFYQDPLTYTPSQTSITPLGTVQEFQLGDFLRSRYIDAQSPFHIGLNPLFNMSQVIVRADAGGEGGVIFDSSIALLQGLFPKSPKNKVTLANGTTVTAPLMGYTYVPIESVEPNNDVSLEGFTSCPALDTKTAAFYASPEFQQVAEENAGFLNALVPIVGDRNVTLVNMWNIYDFMNVESIHNRTFLDSLPPTFLAQAHALANFHEYGVFSDPDPDGIGNIAARTVLPSILTAMSRIANASDPLLFHYSAISYKPFLSLFNMTGVVNNGELPGGIVNYAAALALEIRQSPNASEPVVRFNFKNGTDDDTFIPHQMVLPNFSGPGDVPLSTFISALSPDAVNTTLQWCEVCMQNTARGCAALLNPVTPNATLVARDDATLAPVVTVTQVVATIGASHEPLTPLAAGFIGAFSALAFAFISIMILGCVTTKNVSKEKPTTAAPAPPRRNSDETLTETKAVV